MRKSVDVATARQSASSFAKAGKPRKPEDLMNHAAIRQRLITTGVVYRWEFERRGKEFSVDTPGSIVVDDVALMLSLARDGAGIAYMPDEPIEQDVAEGRLERVLESFITKGPGFYLYFPARTQEQPKLRALIDMVAKLRVGGDAQSGQW